MKNRSKSKRRPPSLPVISPDSEAPDDLELAAEVRKIELSTSSSVYGRGQSRY